jgi:hypothetical protein
MEHAAVECKPAAVRRPGIGVGVAAHDAAAARAVGPYDVEAGAGVSGLGDLVRDPAAVGRPGGPRRRADVRASGEHARLPVQRLDDDGSGDLAVVPVEDERLAVGRPVGLAVVS